MDIRAATVDDYPAIAVISAEVGIQHHEALPRVITPSPMSEGAFRALLADPNITCMIGVDQGELVGFVIYKIVEQPADEYFYAQRFLYVQEINVSRKHHRKGYGEALMNHALDAARAAGVQRVTLRVFAFNQGAVAFYERLGFAPQSIMMTREL